MNELDLKKTIIESSFPSFIPVKWGKPPIGWLKLNSDGSAIGNPTTAGAGGVIRDDQGNWVVGYEKKLGFGSNNMAELWGVRKGVEIALEGGIKVLEIETDSMFVFNCLSKTIEETNQTYVDPLIYSCRFLTQQLEQVRIKHAHREANGVADVLAKFAPNMEERLLLFASVPNFCMAKFAHDSAGFNLRRTMMCKT